MASKSKRRRHFERFIRVYLYAFIPLILGVATRWVDAATFEGSAVVSVAIAAFGTAYRMCFPGVVKDDVVVGRVEG